TNPQFSTFNTTARRSRGNGRPGPRVLQVGKLLSGGVRSQEPGARSQNEEREAPSPRPPGRGSSRTPRIPLGSETASPLALTAPSAHNAPESPRPPEPGFAPGPCLGTHACPSPSTSPSSATAPWPPFALCSWRAG